jgi:hypothetical protein
LIRPPAKDPPSSEEDSSENSVAFLIIGLVAFAIPDLVHRKR